MGEKIALLASGRILGTTFEIEVNKPHAQGMPNDIHIQSERFRYQMNEKEFLKLALTVLAARRKLAFMKGLDANE